MIGRVLPIAAAGCAVGLDAATKGWAEGALAPGAPVPVLGEVVRLRLGYNRGIAFGLLADGGLAWLVPTGVLVVLVGVWFVTALRVSPSPLRVWALGSILAGGGANLLDRWSDGRVTDFIDIGLGAARWPTFNAADVWISLGVAALVAATLRDERAGGGGPAVPRSRSWPPPDQGERAR